MGDVEQLQHYLIVPIPLLETARLCKQIFAQLPVTACPCLRNDPSVGKHIPDEVVFMYNIYKQQGVGVSPAN